MPSGVPKDPEATAARIEAAKVRRSEERVANGGQPIKRRASKKRTSPSMGSSEIPAIVEPARIEDYKKTIIALEADVDHWQGLYDKMDERAATAERRLMTLIDHL